jgi:hypothetical protein
MDQFLSCEGFCNHVADLRGRFCIDLTQNVDIRLLTTDVGIVTAYLRFVSMTSGKKVKGKNAYQDVYVKRNGRWYAVAAHVTFLGAE